MNHLNRFQFACLVLAALLALPVGLRHLTVDSLDLPIARPPLAVSPHLYETDIHLLRELGADADAFELLRRQFRVVSHRNPVAQIQEA